MRCKLKEGRTWEDCYNASFRHDTIVFDDWFELDLLPIVELKEQRTQLEANTVEIKSYNLRFYALRVFFNDAQDGYFFIQLKQSENGQGITISEFNKRYSEKLRFELKEGSQI